MTSIQSAALVAIFVSLPLTGIAQTAKSGGKETADAFMRDLTTNQIDDALDLMETDFLKAIGGRAPAKSAVERLFEYCGRPINIEFQHEERGYKLYLDGRRKPMRKMFYDAATDRNPKGVCFFSVGVVQGNSDSEYKVTEFAPLKRLGTTAK